LKRRDEGGFIVEGDRMSKPKHAKKYQYGKKLLLHIYKGLHILRSKSWHIQACP
jgi:hypothetical protein